jgi:formylglycine-generating enzyme required for sulfatase activity
VSRVDVPETTVEVGASDWEAEGKVASRVVHVNAFRIDAFEATTHAVYGAGSDGARAAAGLSRDEAAEFCARRGGRLPTDDEWLVAAAGGGATRYPWGDTGAVCRRAAWGLAKGPCSDRGQGPDTVGAHPDGDSALGLHDMAGNVAEWVAPRHAAEAAGPAQGVARGGTWASPLAADLRVWSRIVLPADAHDPRVGVRCAYDAPP